MRRMRIYTIDALLAQDATASMRRMRRGVIGGDTHTAIPQWPAFPPLSVPKKSPEPMNPARRNVKLTQAAIRAALDWLRHATPLLGAERKPCDVRLRAARRAGELLKELAKEPTAGLNRGTTSPLPRAAATGNGGKSAQSVSIAASSPYNAFLVELRADMYFNIQAILGRYGAARNGIPGMRSNPEVKLGGDSNECPSCGRLFRSSHAFDKHRIGNFDMPTRFYDFPRRCMTEEEMLAAGMAQNARGFWVGSLRDGAGLDFREEGDESEEQKAADSEAVNDGVTL